MLHIVSNAEDSWIIFIELICQWKFMLIKWVIHIINSVYKMKINANSISVYSRCVTIRLYFLKSEYILWCDESVMNKPMHVC